MTSVVPHGDRLRTPSALVIGVGNEFRGDDAVGIVVARMVRSRAPRGVRISELTGDATRLIDMWAGVDQVVLVDAMRSGRAPGTIVRLELVGGAGPGARLDASTALRSSHALGVLDALALSRQFGTLPKSLVAYGVEGEDFALGGLLSRGVSAAVPELASRVLAEVDAARAAGA